MISVPFGAAKITVSFDIWEELKDPGATPGMEDVLKGGGRGMEFNEKFIGEGKLVKATAAKHSENKLKFCGHAKGMSSGVSTFFTDAR